MVVEGVIEVVIEGDHRVIGDKITIEEMEDVTRVYN